MTVTEALGTGEIPFWQRLFYWLVVMESGALIGAAVTLAVRSFGRLQRHPVLEVCAIALLMALPLTLVVLSAGMVFFGFAQPSLPMIARNYMLVAFISLAVTAIVWSIGARGDSDGQEPEAQSAPLPAEIRLRARLPIALRHAPILALSSEDHYVRVHTPAGSALILLRLSDAVAEIDGVIGAQTHRSWWVARDAVAAVSRGDGKAVLTLIDGTEAPVSRSFYRPLATLGWLD